MTIIDRRKTNKNKSVGNRKKFIERNKERIKRYIENTVADGKGITDAQSDRKVILDDIDEPSFNYDLSTGQRDIVFPGNKNLQKGDKIYHQPDSDEEGSQGSDQGDGFDEFVFTLTKEEFLELYFSDMQLPNFIKQSLQGTTKHLWKRTGYSKEGIPARLDLVKTLKQALARRIATSSKRYLDDIDLRYKHFTKQPFPVRQAVMMCVDKDTEYLSPEGWKKIDQYDNGEVAQYTKKGEAIFVKPLKYVHNPEEKEFIKIKNGVLNQCLTKDHRVIYKTVTGNIKEIMAKELMIVHNSTNNGFRGRIPTSFDINREGISLTNEEIQFHIAFKADGTYQRNNKTNTRAQFCFAKTRKIFRLISILTKLGWKYKISEFGYRTNIYVTTPYRIEKRFGPEWYKANPVQSKLISEEVKLWDGSKRTFSSKYKEDCDYVQYIWSSNGHGTNLLHSRGCWITSQCRTVNRSLASKSPNKIKYVNKLGGSYCFSVPSGMWIARRKGKVFITGNCLMDISASMGKHEKKLAKKFFLLLYLFLNKVYNNKVDVIFISHTQEAKEVSEQEFFYGRETGGTIVSSGLALAKQIIDTRIDINSTNVYIAQCSDGDNWDGDEELSTELLEELLTRVQYFAYIQTESAERKAWKEKTGVEDLMTMYTEIASRHEKLQARHVTEPSEVYPVLRSLFENGRIK